jgi:putative DNA primase/helicase
MAPSMTWFGRESFRPVSSSGWECATADELTGWEEEEATVAAVKLFKAWLEARGSDGRADDEAIIRQVRLFVEQHGEARFRRLDGADERTINNRAGYFDDGFYYFSRKSFCAEVCKGYDPMQASRALERRGLLKTNHGLQCKKHDPETGKTPLFTDVSHLPTAKTAMGRMGRKRRERL